MKAAQFRCPLNLSSMVFRLEPANSPGVQSPQHGSIRENAIFKPKIQGARAHAAGISFLRRRHGSGALLCDYLRAMGVRNDGTLVDLDGERCGLPPRCPVDGKTADPIACRLPSAPLG